MVRWAPGTIPEPPASKLSSMQVAMHLKKNPERFHEITAMLRELAREHLDVTKLLKEQDPRAFAIVSQKARQHRMMKFYIDAWPIRQYIKRWLSNHIHRAHKKRQAGAVTGRCSNKICSIGNDGPISSTTVSTTSSASYHAVSKLGTRAKSSQLSLPMPSAQRAELQAPPNTPTQDTSISLLPFASYLRSCTPSLAHLVEVFHSAGIKNERDLMRVALLSDRYQDELLRERMQLSDLEIMEVQTVLDNMLEEAD